MTDTAQNPNKMVGIEITTSAFRAVCLDASGAVVDAHKSPMVRGDDTAPQLALFVSALQSKFGEFERAGITIPGLVDSSKRRVAFSASFPEHQDTDFLPKLETATGLRLLMENDANAAAFGEFTLGAGRGSNDLFYVTLGAGVGGAFIFDGRIWHGSNGFAGEFGYLAIDDDGRRLEEVASATSIVRRTRSRFHQDSTSSLGGLPESEITVADVVREAAEGDDFAHLMLERTGRHVGTAIAGVINLLNIDKIVLGGEVMQGDTVLNAIVSRASELSFKPSFQATRIEIGELGDQASAIGAALLSKTL